MALRLDRGGLDCWRLGIGYGCFMRDGVGGPSSVGIGGEALEQRGDNGGEGDVVLSGPEPCLVMCFVRYSQRDISGSHWSSGER